MSMKDVTLDVNDFKYELKTTATETLTEVIREKIGLTGTKIMCEEGDCGSCTVLVDGKAMLSCLMLAVECEEKKIITIEGLANHETGALHPIQKAFVDFNGIQCGICTPGMVITAKALLDENPDPDEDDVRNALSGNLCRCGNYRRITECVLAASKMMRDGGGNG